MTVISASFLLPNSVDEKEDLILEHAERMNRHQEDDNIILYLVEDVRWRKGETIISSDAAAYKEEEGWLRLTGNVIIAEPERTIHADTVDYYEEDDKAIATGAVTVFSENEKQELRTNWLMYERENDYMTALNRPTIIIKREEDEGDSTQLNILGNRVVSCGEDSLFIIGEVIVEGDSLSAECDSAFYDLENDWIKLREDPAIMVTDHTTRGDEVDLYIPDEQLVGAVVRGSARAEGNKELEEKEEKVGEERFWATADSLVLFFEDEELSELTAISNARSLVEREDKEHKIEKNYVTGDVIVVEMDEREVEKVQVEGNGKGVYVAPPDTTQAGTRSE